MFVIVVGKSVVKRINDYHKQSLLMVPQCRVEQIIVWRKHLQFLQWRMFALWIRPRDMWYLHMRLC